MTAGSSKAAKKRKIRSSDYKGVLKSPIYEPIPTVGMLGGDNLIKRRCELRAMKKFQAKLPSLFKWYGIEPNAKGCWSELALRLAMVHVPGMRIIYKPRSGRKRTWKAGLGPSLIRDVEAIKRRGSRAGKKKLSDRQAISVLLKTQTKYGRHVESVESRLREARREERYSAAREQAMLNDPKSITYQCLTLNDRTIKKRRK